MKRSETQLRQMAVARYLAGESATAICASVGRGRTWLYKWRARYTPDEPQWYQERSRRPAGNPRHVAEEMEQTVLVIRAQLTKRGEFMGAQAIQWELEELGLGPVPSLRTLNRILYRYGLIQRRQGRYQSKHKRYPLVPTTQMNQVHVTDFVGPCYLTGGLRFYSLNTMDQLSKRCAVEPLLTRDSQTTIDALWATWQRLGIPQHVQVDNEMVFYGSPTHPRGMGSLIRLCLLYDVESWFIPIREPWRNGSIEKFNDYFQDKFLARVPLSTVQDLHTESRQFEHRHNSRWRYSTLGSKTPLQVLQASAVSLRFPDAARAPQYPLKKPETGKYHLVRFIRSDATLNVFSECFPLPPETVYEYVVATIDVALQQLRVTLDGKVVAEWDYHLR